jgi:hypothetical protein
VLDVERWAGLNRVASICGRRVDQGARPAPRDRSRNGVPGVAVRRATGSPTACGASKLDLLRTRSNRPLKADPKLRGLRIREGIAPLEFDGVTTIVDDCLRDVRPLFVRRNSQ